MIFALASCDKSGEVYRRIPAVLAKSLRWMSSTRRDNDGSVMNARILNHGDSNMRNNFSTERIGVFVKFDKKFGIRKILLMVVAAALFSLLLIQGSALVNARYYERWPLQGDTASYWIRDIRISERIPLAGDHRAAALELALENNRDPARTAFFAALPADKIYSVNGHLFFTAIAAFLFFLTLIHCLWVRTSSLMYSLGAPLVTLLAMGVLNPTYGAPSKLPDFPAALLMGASLFAIFSSKGRHWKWVFISGVLLGLSTLTRYHAWIYGGFVIGPIVMAYAARRYFLDGRQFRDLIGFPSAFMAGLLLVAGWFIVHWANEIFRFYMIAGYGLNSTVHAALNTTGRKLITQYFGVVGLTSVMFLMASYVATRWKTRDDVDRFDLALVVWAALSYLFLLIVIMRVEDDVTQTYYAVPGITLLFLAPFIYRSLNEAYPKAFRIFSGLAIGVLVVATIFNFRQYASSESFLYPRPESAAIAKFNRELTDMMVANMPVRAESKYPVIDSNFDYYARFLIPEIHLRYGRLSTFGNVFQIRQSQWQLSFTGRESEDQAKIMEALLKKVDIFASLVASSPDAAHAAFKDEYTHRIAAFVDQEMSANPKVWEPRGTVIGPLGKITVYLNKSRN